MECVSGDLGVAGRRKRGWKQKKKAKGSSSFAKAGKAGCFEALENAGGASGDSGAESDSSLLQELTKLIIEAENQEVNSEEEEENGVDENKELTLKLQQDKIEKLSASVTADVKYVRGGSVAASGIRSKPSSKSTPAEEKPEDRRKIQNLEAAIGDHELKSAIKSLASTKSGLATDHLATCMEHVSESYGGLLQTEEQAEESLIELAHRKHGDVDSTNDHASGSCSSVGDTTVKDTSLDNAYVWAKQLFKFASAFRKHQGDFFASRDMNKDLYRSISLVHFVDGMADLGEFDIPKEPKPTVEEDMASGSTIQFVHWDRPEKYCGRRLRLERGRFVWRPPGRSINGRSEDDVSDLFTKSMARVILHDCGARLVKAKGDFRTQVPEDVPLIYKCLSAAASASHDGGSDGDMGPCFVCKTLTDLPYLPVLQPP